jgi:hypothetical protein
MISITDLFTMPMATAQIPNHQPLCEELTRLFLEKEKGGDKYRYHKRRATQFGPLFESKFDLFKWKDESVALIARFCHGCLSELIQEITEYDKEELGKLRFDYQAWFHITRKGGYQGLHNHQNASWSGIFCVDPGDPVADRQDSGLVRYHDPRSGSFNYSDAGNLGLRLPYRHGGFDIVHSAGRLILFPSYVMHEIFAYQGDRPRIVIAFNCSIN